MENPVLVEVLRGAIVESRHRGAVAVYDADGGSVLEIGDVGQPVFPRSAVKSIQALPLVETGTADAYGFGDRELALACASHSGEPEHAELARSMLASAGRDEPDLECGSHWPGSDGATIGLAAVGRKPSQLHNNCSGKHSAFVCTCVHAGIDHHGYVDYGHRYQAMIRDVMQDVTGAAHGEGNWAIDGCSIPTYAVPIRHLARGFARMATGVGLGPERARAAKRLFSACMTEPFYVAGTDKADTRLMRAAPGRVFVKTGAEGVYCAALPGQGIGIALKCDDGAGRGAEVIIAAVLARLFQGADAEREALRLLATAPVPTRKGVKVGEIRTTPALS